jgi:hypothetical protein
MASYQGTVNIHATPSTVIGLLHNLRGWTSWTSTILEATPLGSGVVQPGARVRARQPGLPVSVWTVDVVDDHAFEWNNYRHGLRTVATHDIDSTPEGSRLTVTIRQEGPLAGPVGLLWGRVIRHHLSQMMQDLKTAAESAAGTETLDLDRGHRHAEPEQELRRSFSENR